MRQVVAAVTAAAVMALGASTAFAGPLTTTKLAGPAGGGRIVFGAAFLGVCDPSGATVCSSDKHGRSVQAVPVPPNAQQVVFSRDAARMAFVVSGGELAVANADGTIVTTLIDGWVQINHPSWSPDGTQIAFAGERFSGGPLTLYVINADGSGLRPVADATSAGSFASEPAWSPDGNWIAFNSLPDSSTPGGPTNPSGIYLVHPDGTDWHRISPTATDNDQSPAWSPDGTRIVFARLASDWQTTHISSLWQMRPDGTDAEQLTTGYWDGHPIVSPDGKQIAFYRYQGAQPDPHVYVMNANGHSADQLLSIQAAPTDWITG